MQNVKIIFFGSTSDSLIVLNKLHSLVIGHWSLDIVSVVTQPPRPVGRKQTMTPTPVEMWAKEHKIPVLSFASHPEKSWAYADEQQVIDTLQPFKADLIVSACYGQKIPSQTISSAQFGGLNVHPSLLPRWRGADPVPWAILSGDHQTGVTVVTLSEKFDDGNIIAQKKIPIVHSDTSPALRTKLFTIGADLLIEVLPGYLSRLSFPRTRESRVKKIWIPGSSPRMTIRSMQTKFPYARRLSRHDGYEPWEALEKSFLDPDEAIRIDRKFRAFSPWPGVWTEIAMQATQASPARPDNKQKQRLKILACHLSPEPYRLIMDIVQLEGKTPVSWKQFVSAHIPMQLSN